MDGSLSYYLGFSHFLGIGPIKFNALLKNFDVKTAYELSESDLSRIVGPQTSRKFIEFRSKFDSAKKQEELRAKNIQVITRADPKYPEELRELTDAPICLYVKGSSESLRRDGQFNFAVVGTRKAAQ